MRKIFYLVIRAQQLYVIAVILAILFFIGFVYTRVFTYMQTLKPVTPAAKLAIIIDDFGQARAGVKEMLSVDAPLTVAVMPRLQFSQQDMEDALAAGKEVIIHIPLQAQKVDNPKWVGPYCIKRSQSDEEICNLMLSFFDDLPKAAGANIHMGTLGSEDSRVMSGIIERLKEKNMYFVDSKTSGKSVCKAVAKEYAIPFGENSVFLEQQGRSVKGVVSQMQKAAKLALKNGQAIAIGHVGPEGGTVTANGIAQSLPTLREMGVEVVFASEIADIVE